MTKTIDRTLDHALFFARRLQNCNPMCVVLLILIELRLETQKDGFGYLKHSIVRFLQEPGHLTTDIYPPVMELYSTKINSLQMDNAIRAVIDDAWKRRDDETWSYYFPPDRNGKIRRPSNAEFISRIAVFVELWQGCCKGDRVCQTIK